MRPSGSSGREAFASALEHLRSWSPHLLDRPPAFHVTLAGGPGSSFGSSTAAAPAPLHDGHAPTGTTRTRAGPGCAAEDAAPAGVRQDRTAADTAPAPAAHRATTIAGAAQALREDSVTSRMLVEQSLAAIGKHDAELHAVVHLMAEEALSEAAARDEEAAAGRWRGPLHGIPVTVKDVIDVAGAPTRAGSAAFCRIPSGDAASVALLRRAGAVVLAKVSTHEFALGVTTPQSRNPHDPTRIPGGSSGGSAIAVAMGMGLGSLGTDTRASTRVPAALCGVVGLKPTLGAVPTRGVVPLSWTMDHVGQLARTVQDAALLLSAVASPAHDWASAVGMPIEGLRVGVPRAAFEGSEPGVAAGVDDALGILRRLGCTVSDAARPTGDDLAATNAAALLVSRCEAAAFHRHLGADRSLYWDEVADQLDAADEVSAVDYIDAQRLRADLQEAFAAVFEDHDVLAMPTTPCVAPPADDFARYLLVLSRNASPWSLTGLPALTLPCGTTGGLPFGLQLVAPPWHEDRLIRVGSALEQALKVHSARTRTPTGPPPR